MFGLEAYRILRKPFLVEKHTNIGFLKNRQTDWSESDSRVIDHAEFELKGVVDKNFEAVDNFNGQIRIQHGQLP